MNSVKWEIFGLVFPPRIASAVTGGLYVHNVTASLLKNDPIQWIFFIICVAYVVVYCFTFQYWREHTIQIYNYLQTAVLLVSNIKLSLLYYTDSNIFVSKALPLITKQAWLAK